MFNNFTPEQEQQIQHMIDLKVSTLFKNEKYVFSKDIEILDKRSIQVGKTNGTSFGTATDQKISVYGVDPVVQASAISAPTVAGALYSQSQVQSIVDAVNYIRTAIKNFGITA